MTMVYNLNTKEIRNLHRDGFNDESIVIKTPKFPMQFWNMVQYRYTDIENNDYTSNILTIKTYYRYNNENKFTDIGVPLLLYILNRIEIGYLFKDLLNLSFNDIHFTNSLQKDNEQYAVFRINDEIYLNMNKKLLTDPEPIIGINVKNLRPSSSTIQSVISSILYILSTANLIEQIEFKDIGKKIFYKYLLGRELYKNSIAQQLLVSHVESHLESLNTILDKDTKQELRDGGIFYNDVFDLFIDIFFNLIRD